MDDFINESEVSCFRVL
uniref:Putative NBS-LRR disease resistance protein n=1 Tax=Rhizophora mucronata TaxID=61149 RepID=A0A2P2MWY1_RHIMU